MIKLFKKAISKIKRRIILRDIKEAKKFYELEMVDFMCVSFEMVSIKYYRRPISSIIPEFNKDFLNAQYKQEYYNVWWDINDRKSRIKAFDKLIEIYSK